MRSLLLPITSLLAACAMPPACIDPSPPPEIVVSPSALIARGAAPGPTWSPAPRSTLANRSKRPFPLLLDSDRDWLSVRGATTDTLAPAAICQIEPSIDLARLPRGDGPQTGRIRVLNAMTFYCEAELEITWTPPDASSGPTPRSDPSRRLDPPIGRDNDAVGHGRNMAPNRRPTLWSSNKAANGIPSTR